jgi:hypothetical protein
MLSLKETNNILFYSEIIKVVAFMVSLGLYKTEDHITELLETRFS